MPTINLTAKGHDQELILAYLTENASDILANKINNGTPFEKDGKQLINRKDLDGFMKYAGDETLKLIAQNERKGTVMRCLEDATVYGWAIHYFEEDSIQGKLFNPDGTEYKPPAPVKKTVTKPTAPATPPPKPKSQFSFFDLLNEKKDEKHTEAAAQANNNNIVDNTQQQDDNPTVEEIADRLQQAVEQKQQQQPEQPQPKQIKQEQSMPKNPIYEKYITYVNRHPDSVIAMRVGDFYEVFGKKATLIADKVGLTLTGRDLGLEQRIPMVGFPCHAAEAYFKKIRQSYSLVIVDDDGERKLDEFGIEDVLEKDDELTEEEMRLFDGDFTEPKDIPETIPANEPPKAACEPTTDSDSPYNEIALAKVVKLLGDNFILR